MASGAGLGARSLPLRSGPRVTTRPLTTDSGRSATRSYPGRSVPSFALNISHCDLPGGPPWVRTRCHCPRSFFPWKSTRMWPFFRCSESWPGGTESAVPLSQISESPAPYSPPGPSPRARATIRRSSGWPSRRIVARALGDGPGGERSVHLQPDVVVQARGVVLVHHEGGLGVRLHLSRRRLGGDGEVPLRLVLRQLPLQGGASRPGGGALAGRTARSRHVRTVAMAQRGG